MTAHNTPTNTVTWLLNTGRILTLFMLVGIFISTALLSLTETTLLFVWILLAFLGQWRDQLHTAQYFPLTVSGLALLALIVLQTSYSPAPIQDALKQVVSYRELLLLPILLYFFNDERWKKRLYYLFMACMLAAIVHSYLQFLGVMAPVFHDKQANSSTLSRIFGAIFLAFACFVFLEEAIKHTRLRYKMAWAGIFLVASFALMFFFAGRTGMMIYLCLLLLWGYRFMGKKGIILALVAGTVLIVGIYYTSPYSRDRLDFAETEAQQLFQAQPDSPHCEGIMHRYQVYRDTVTHITARQLLTGNGTGSFITERNCFTHPHSEFLLLLYENGIVGLLLLLLFLYFSWRSSEQARDTHNRWLIRALVATFAVGSLFNSLLLDNNEAHAYILLLTALLPVIANRKPTPANV